MLTDAAGTVAVSNLGWVDHGSLWTFHASDRRSTVLPIGDASHLTLHPGMEGHFSVVQHANTRVTIAVHHFADVGRALAAATIGPEGTSFSGDEFAWRYVPSNYTAFLQRPVTSDFVLIRLNAPRQQAHVHPFEWFNDTDYDKGYQGIVGVTEVPGEELLLVSVQRDSRLVLYDPHERVKRGSIKLAGRGGNPDLFFRRRAAELWAVDYDTVLKIEPESWRAITSRRLQDSDLSGSAQFVGSLWFNAEETICVVARPFSGDVVALDPADLTIKAVVPIGGQPLEAVILASGHVIARDWQTGKLLQHAM